jgi:hypothetical protein
VISDPGGAASVPTVLAVSGSRISTADRSVSAGAQSVLMLRFSLNTSTSAGLFESITLQASGSGNDVADVNEVVLWLDTNQDGQLDAGDNQIGQGLFSADNGVLTLNASPALALPAGQSDFLVTYNF